MKKITPNLVTPFLTVGIFASLFLFALPALTHAISAFQIQQGGTGTSTPPTNGQMLIADANGNYEYVASSSLGSSSGTTYTATYPITLTGSAFGSALATTSSNTWAGTQTFTNPLAVGTGISLFSGTVAVSSSTDQTTVGELSCGSSASASNYCINISGGRTMFGYDSSVNGSVIDSGGGKGLFVYVNGTNNNWLSGNLSLGINGTPGATFGKIALNSNSTTFGDATTTIYTAGTNATVSDVTSQQVNAAQITFQLLNPNVTAGSGITEAFTDSSAGSLNYTGAISSYRTGGSGQGGLFLSTKASTSNGVAPVNALNIDQNQNIGIGTTTATARLVSVAASTTAGTVETAYAGQVSIIAGFENTVLKIFQDIDQWGHLITSGDAPTITSCGSTPSGTVSGNDRNGTITVGGTATGCTLTFAHAYQTAPDCVISNQGMSVVNALTYTVSASAVTISQTGLSSDLVNYICQAHQ